MSEDKTISAYLTPELEQMAHEIADSLYRYDRLADKIVPTLADITEEHVKQYWRDGFLVIEQALSEEEVASSLEAIMDIIFKRSVGSRTQFVKPESALLNDRDRELAARKVYQYIDHEPRLHAIAYQQGIMNAMEMLFGEKTKVVQDMAILKPPSGGAEKPWHQDMAYGNLAYDKPVAGIWIALDAAELDNGCMHVIPGSHRDGGVPHYAVRDWQLCDTSVAVPRDVAVPLKPGGALIFSGLLHHGTPPNFSDKRRRALQLHYVAESAEKMAPKEYKRMFTNEMTKAEC